MSVITESERKRLRSLKEKKQAFKAKGQLIQQALSNLVSLRIVTIFSYDNLYIYYILFLHLSFS